MDVSPSIATTRFVAPVFWGLSVLFGILGWSEGEVPGRTNEDGSAVVALRKGRDSNRQESYRQARGLGRLLHLR